MTAEEVRYPDIYLETPVPAQRKSPEKSERGDPSFGFAEYFTERRPGGASSDARGEGPSASTSGGAVKLAAQVKELQVRRFSLPLGRIRVPVLLAHLMSTTPFLSSDPKPRRLTGRLPRTPYPQAKLAERSSELEAIKVRERRRASSTSHHPTPEPRLLVFPRTAR
jgi:hypothetical protein